MRKKVYVIIIVTLLLLFLHQIPAQPKTLLKETFDTPKISGKAFKDYEFVTVNNYKSINLTSLTGAVGYSGEILNEKEGTIEFWWLSPPNLVEFYTTRQPEWKDYTYDGKIYHPPTGGYLLDQIAWFGAKPGCFSLELTFHKDKATLCWRIWDGKKRHDARWICDSSFWTQRRWYHIAVSYGPKGLKLYVDRQLRAENLEYRGGVYRGYMFYLGQNQNELRGIQNIGPMDHIT